MHAPANLHYILIYNDGEPEDNNQRNVSVNKNTPGMLFERVGQELQRRLGIGEVKESFRGAVLDRHRQHAQRLEGRGEPYKYIYSYIMHAWYGMVGFGMAWYGMVWWGLV